MPSLRHYLEQGESVLKGGPHPERARRDAELLLMHSLKRSRAWLITHYDESLADDLSVSYAELFKRRCKGEPIQYITGEAEFYGLPFRVTPDVLIPRPETEHLVEKVIELTSGFVAPRIVDVGTGSGAIAVALAQKLPHAFITATDLSSRALKVAEENAKRNGVSIRFLAGDLLAPVEGERFEIIVSNPPYVAIADQDSLDVEVREYEPALALFAGDDGLDVYRRLIPAAFDTLVQGGFVALEIGYGQSTAVGDLLARTGFECVEFVPDLQGILRVACAQRR
jgi:release factor glutamine methyltransferase